ncbi:MAG TPA: PPC domain-containing protein, partial [Methylomirabilota bacterium]|nr:PPC domain-containing protein [Methylomirabilota bacterium]
MAARPFLWPILLILWSLWAPMAAQGQYEDAYERNDSLDQSAFLGWLADGILEEPLLTLWPSGDDDYFLFGMVGRGRAGDYIEVFALVAGPLFGCGNATIALHDANGTELVSQVTGLCGGTVRFDMAGRAPGWYYLSVRCSSLEYGTYEITSRLPREYEPDFIEGEEYLLLATHAGAGTFGGLNIHQFNDEDWFGFPLHANAAPNDFVRINFSNAEGNLDLALYRLEDLLANTNSLPPPIRSSISIRDFEEIGLTNLPAGEYVLRVYGNGYTSPGYTLTVQTPGQPILVWPFGTGTFSFDTVPAVTEFSTGILVGDAATFTEAAQVDAAVSGLSLTNVNQALPISGTLPPSAFGGGFRFNTNGLYLQSRPTTTSGAPPGLSNAANLLLATLRNYSGENRPDVAISYSFDVQNALSGELPGFDVYYSLTGSPGSWQRIPALSRNETPGTHTALLSLGSWPPGALLYLLWADDNANGITDPSYTIDDFTAWLPVVRPDRFEPNDWVETNDLPTILTNHPLYGLVFEPDLSLHTTNDWDWFAFETTGWGTSDHYLRANFDPTWSSVDLFLYNEAGLLAAFNDPENFLFYAVGYSFGLTNSAEIRLANLPPDVYFLLAFSADQRIQPYYQLTVFAPLRDERGDYLEVNDTFQTATNLGAISGLRAWPGLSLHNEQDVDLMRFQLPTTGRLEDFVSIRFSHEAGDLDLALFDSRTNLVGYSDGETDNETISLSGLAPGTYTILVFGYAQAVNPNYTLSIHAPGINTTIPLDRYETNNSVAQVTNQPVGWPFSANLGPLSRAARIPDLTIHQAGDADWFRFELPVEGVRGQFVALLHDYRLGDLDLLLCNSNGVPIPGRSSAGWREVEQVDLQGLPPGAYFVVVTGATASVTHPAYDLVFNAATSDGNDGGDITSTQREVTNLGQVRGQRTFTGYGIESASDVDWFRFTLAAPGRAGHHARILFSHAVGDLDLRLVDSDGATLLDASSGVTDIEEVSLEGLQPGQSYFLYVFGYEGAVNSQFTIVFNAPTDSSGDRFENNNTPALATLVNDLLSFDRAQSTLTVGDASAPLSIHATNDVDWFRFDFARAADATHFAAISFDHTQGDLDLALFATNNTAEPLREDQGVSSGHRVSLQGLPPGEYLLRVSGYNGAVNPAYLLSINAPWDAVGPDVFEENDTAGAPTLVGPLPFGRDSLSIEPGDDDWFRFTLVATGRSDDSVQIGFRHAQGDLDLELWDANGTAVLGRSGGVTDGERIKLAGRSAGTYLVRVFGYNHASNPDYTLTITAPADLTGDWAEKPRPGVNNNDSAANAFDLREVRGFQTWDPLSLHTVNDQDWFRFSTIGQALRGHFVRIEFDRTLGDLDLYVYAATNTNWVASSATGDGIEQVDLSQLPGGGAAGVYLAHVVRHNNAGSSTPYRLVVNAPMADFGDWAENNNSRTNATDLHEVQGTQLWQNLSLHRSGDEDWFKFTTVGAGVEGHAVSILSDQSLGDLNLEVWTNLAGPPLLSTNVSDHETVSLAGAPRGTTNAPLYVRVFGANHATHPNYALLITAPRAPEPDWAETNNTQLAATPLREVEDAITLNNLSIHTGGDVDWFRFTLTQPPRRGQFVRIEFNHHEGNLQLVVLGPNGFARTNDTAANVEEIGLAGLSTGTYFVKVSGVAGAINPAYTLAIQATPKLQP